MWQILSLFWHLRNPVIPRVFTIGQKFVTFSKILSPVCHVFVTSINRVVMRFIHKIYINVTNIYKSLTKFLKKINILLVISEILSHLVSKPSQILIWRGFGAWQNGDKHMTNCVEMWQNFRHMLETAQPRGLWGFVFCHIFVPMWQILSQ